MKSITLIVLYFGKLPDYFKFFLKSCSYNPTIDWLIYTDDNTNFNYPPNVYRIITSLDETIQKIENEVGFKVSIPWAYKLTDFKPIYGLIFREYLIKADYWGHCDIDLIFGNIRKFVTEELLKENDKIFANGHLTIFRNNRENNSVFKREIDGIFPYHCAFTDPKHLYFDEWGKGLISINRLYEHYKLPMSRCNVFHDLNSRKFLLIPENITQKKYRGGGFYIWKKGRLFWHPINNPDDKEEILYIHFQKRKMTDLTSSNQEEILVIANYFYDLPESLEFRKILRRQKLFFLNSDSWKFYYVGIKRKFFSSGRPK